MGVEDILLDKMQHAKVMSSMFRPHSEEENNSWLKIQADSLPSYYEFCNRVHMDLYQMCNIQGASNSNKFIWWILCPFVYLVPIGHVFTEIGVIYWYIVVEKYVIFLFVCTGFWTEQCVEGYDMENVIAKMQLPDQGDDANDQWDNAMPVAVEVEDDNQQFPADNDNNQWSFIKGRMSRWFEVFSEVFDSNDTTEGEYESDRNDDNAEIIHAICAPRAILLQAVSALVPLSIYAINGVSAPVFIVGNRCRKLFPPLFFSWQASLRRAEKREKLDSNQSKDAKERRVYWAVIVKAFHICNYESRWIQITKNMLNFAFTLSILYSDGIYTILMVSIILLLPFFFVQLLDLYVIIGRKMKISDYDLYYLVKYFEPSYASQLYSEGGGGSGVVEMTMTEVVVTD
jgi:hypothetical protein